MSKRLLILIIILFASVTAILTPLFAQELIHNKYINEALDAAEDVKPRARIIEALDIRDRDILEVLDILAKEAGLKIVVDEPIEGKITIILTRVDVYDALRIILDMHNLAYRREKSTEQLGIKPVIHVMTAATYQTQLGQPFSQKLHTKVINIKYGNIERIVALLNEKKSPVGKIIHEEKVNTLVLMDHPEILEMMVSAVESLDVSQETNVFVLKFINAMDILKEVTDLLTQNIGEIQLDEEENSLRISDTVLKMKVIKEYIYNHDFLKRNILIESQVIQITLNDEHLQGVDWEAIVSDFQSLFFPSFDQDQLLSPKSKMSFGTVSDEDYIVLLDALDTVGNINEISKSVDPLDQKNRMTLKVREKDLSALFVDGGEWTQSEMDEEVGLRISAEALDIKTIAVNLKPELTVHVSRLSKSISSQEEINVLLNVGHTIVIGGIFKEVVIASEKKIPVLGSLPLLGKVFKKQGKRILRNEVIIFVTPKFEE